MYLKAGQEIKWDREVKINRVLVFDVLYIVWWRPFIVTVKINILLSTLDDNHRTGTYDIVQAIKSVEENMEDCKKMKIRDETMHYEENS